MSTLAKTHQSLGEYRALAIFLSAFLLASCDSSVTAPTKYENKIVAYKIDKPTKAEPKDIRRRDSETEKQVPATKEFKFASAKKAFDAYRKYRGAEQVVKSLKTNTKALVSSSQALESLKPAMWWGVIQHGGGGIYADATVAAGPGDFWNVDVVFNCSNVFGQPSMTQEYERVCFHSANNTNDIYYGLASPTFPTGGPNGVMQFEFSTGTGDTFLGVFTMYGYSENVDLYVNDTLVATYNVTFYDREYSFIVELPGGTHRVTAIYTSTSSDRPYAYLIYEQFLLYRL